MSAAGALSYPTEMGTLHLLSKQKVGYVDHYFYFGCSFHLSQKLSLNFLK